MTQRFLYIVFSIFLIIVTTFSPNAYGMIFDKKSFPALARAKLILSSVPCAGLSNQRARTFFSIPKLWKQFVPKNRAFKRNVILAGSGLGLGALILQNRSDSSVDYHQEEIEQKVLNITSLAELDYLLKQNDIKHVLCALMKNICYLNEKFPGQLGEYLLKLIEKGNRDEQGKLTINATISNFNCICTLNDFYIWHFMKVLLKKSDTNQRAALVDAAIINLDSIIINQNTGLWAWFMKPLLREIDAEKQTTIINKLLLNVDVLINIDSHNFWYNFMEVLFKQASHDEKEKITKVMATHFYAISSKEEIDIWNFMATLLEQDHLDAKMQIIDAIAINFDVLMKPALRSSRFMRSLQNQTDDTIKLKIIDAIATNLISINATDNSYNHLWDFVTDLLPLSNGNNHTRAKFVDALLINFNNLITHVFPTKFMIAALEHLDVHEKIKIVDAVAEDFEHIKVLNRFNFWPFMTTLFKLSNIEGKKRITDMVMPNLDAIMQCGNVGNFVLSLFAESDAHEQTIIIAAISANIELPHTPSYLQKLLDSANARIKEPIVDAIIAHQNKSSSNLDAVYFILHYGTHEQLFAFCKKMEFSPDVENLIMNFFNQSNFSLDRHEECHCQTECHIENNRDILLSNRSIFIKYLIHPSLYLLLKKTISQERELQIQGYTTFYHGQRWEYNFDATCYKKIWAIAYDKREGDLEDFVFAHIRPYCKTSECFEREKLHRKKLLQYGRQNDEDRQAILFANAGFFNNESNVGSSTAHYFQSNSNVGNIHVSLKKLFSWFEYDDVYQQFKQQLYNLRKEHHALSGHGNLLMYAIPTEHLDQYVYECKSGGGKKWLNDEKNIKDILQGWKTPTVRKHCDNTDAREFCITMTQDGALNPGSGIKVYSFNTVDQEKYAVYKEKEKALWQEIEQAILQKKKNISATA